ncbi:MAG: hypothetical protein AMJ61_07540 [Desulfobacterales bacterium SG8_35_2]|jgi:hypothetical protein|nr:MAG: hypothetical protein AMJ61_07540 [Desulfobacterales bacterium SG8_35_2]
MKTEKYYRQAGYEQGLVDGKRTNGKIKKKYVENLFKSETQNLSEQESLMYKMGWQDGFVDSVRKTLQSKVRQEDFFEKQLDELYDLDFPDCRISLLGKKV